MLYQHLLALVVKMATNVHPLLFAAQKLFRPPSKSRMLRRHFKNLQNAHFFQLELVLGAKI
jgi:hypothetical protein